MYHAFDNAPFSGTQLTGVIGGESPPTLNIFHCLGQKWQYNVICRATYMRTI